MIEEQEKLLRDLLSSNSFLLIILDACRYDFFQEAYHRLGLGGRLMPVWSTGSHTMDFIESICREPVDAHVVAGNPHYYYRQECFRRGVSHAWLWGWDEKLRTVPADKIVLGVMKALARGEKRIIAHLVQPHAPYIGRTKLLRGNFYQTVYALMGRGGGRPDPMSDVPLRLLIHAYRDNLEYAIRHGVKPLLRIAEQYGIDRVVVTADHGESLWEYRPEPPHYDPHPRRVDWYWLREVPWLEI